ncbi:MAG: glycosyltransferase family 4 protein [Cytophagales bacterium]|nr:glycosyltransferase family 4 protein [Cytophagales bacterium]
MIFVQNLIDSLKRYPVEIRVFSLLSRTSPLTLFKEWRRFRLVEKEFAPHLIHAHFGTMTAFFSMLAATRPLIITYRGTDLNHAMGMNQTRWALGHLLSQLAALRAKAIVCVTEELKKRLWWNKEKTQVIAIGVDKSRFFPMPNNEAKTILGWDTKIPVVLFHQGNSPSHKGLPLVETAMEYVHKKIPEARLFSFSYEIPPAEMPIYLNAADCLAFASHTEGSPTLPKEAIACALPIVSVEVGDVVQSLDGVFPSAIVPRSPKEFGEALTSILKSRKRSNGVELVMSVDEEAKAYYELYQNVPKSPYL